MPDPTSLLNALYLVALATCFGVSYAILTEGGELLAFIPLYFYNRAKSFTKQPFRFKIARKIATCAKCIAGQFTLWGFFFLVSYDDVGNIGRLVLLHVGSIALSIVTTSIVTIYVGTAGTR